MIADRPSRVAVVVTATNPLTQTRLPDPFLM